MTTKDQFQSLLQTNGQSAVYHRDDSMNPCPCRTPEGYRDPIWHLENPSAPICNEAGMLPGSPTDITVKAFIQPIQSTRATRLATERLVELFGEIQTDDHLGIFPIVWNSVALNFYDWGQAGEDYVQYDGRKFQVVNANKMPHPEGMSDGHWEVALRLKS